jgi:hypothetical protein
LYEKIAVTASSLDKFSSGLMDRNFVDSVRSISDFLLMMVPDNGVMPRRFIRNHSLDQSVDKSDVLSKHKTIANDEQTTAQCLDLLHYSRILEVSRGLKEFLPSSESHKWRCYRHHVRIT